MNKYYKLSNLLILITLIFASFFVWKAQAGSLNPDIKLVTMEGQAKHLKPVSFYGQTYQGDYSNFSSFSFRENEVKYPEDKSLIEQIDGYHDLKIDHLVSNYRSFMRGKGPNPDQYVSNDQWLIHLAKNTDFYWSSEQKEEMIISVLSKETKEEKEYTIPLGEVGEYFQIESIHFNHPKISIVMNKYRDDDRVKRYITSFDIDNPENKLTEKINFSDQIDSENFLRFENKLNNNGRFIAIQSIKNTVTDEFEEINEVMGYLVYDTEKEEMFELPTIKEEIVLTDKEHIYLAKEKEDALELSRFNLDENEFSPIASLDMYSDSFGPDFGLQYQDNFNERMVISNGKLYAYGEEEMQKSYLPIFQVIDIDSEETLFFGKLDYMNDSADNQQVMTIYQYRVD